MPFCTTDPTLGRARLVAAHLDGLYPVSELAARFGVSRPTVYKWTARYRDGGAEALADRPSVARTQPGQTPPEVEALLVACRKAHPHWGPRKLLLYLAKRHVGVVLPAPSTVGAILDRHGLTKARRKRRPPKHPGSTPLVAQAPNAVWTADYKGQFRMGDGELCYPLTVCDAHSRYILSCHGLPSVDQYAALSQFERLFREYGLPDAIRSDNGTPFATQALCGLSRLSVWWIKLDIDHQRIDPGQPQPARLGGAGTAPTSGCTARSRPRRLDHRSATWRPSRRDSTCGRPSSTPTAPTTRSRARSQPTSTCRHRARCRRCSRSRSTRATTRCGISRRMATCVSEATRSL